MLLLTKKGHFEKSFAKISHFAIDNFEFDHFENRSLRTWLKQKKGHFERGSFRKMGQFKIDYFQNIEKIDCFEKWSF